MKKEDFSKIQLTDQERYRLVPETVIDELLATRQCCDVLGIPPIETMSLGDLVRYHRARLGMTKTGLTKAAKPHLQPCQLTAIENDDSYSPHKATLDRLCEVFGEGFKQGLRLIKKPTRD